MKKTVYLIIFIFAFSCYFKVNGQNYFKIPTDTNHYWRQFSICLPNPNAVNRLDYQIKYFKDTVIQAKTYNIYGTFGRQWGFEYCRSFIKRGFLRQDTIAKKVFILDSAYVERPLYDFSKNLNDTLLSYDKVLNSNVTLTVTNVATATLSDGTYHKALWVSNGNCFIEGAGSVFGGLYGHNQAPFSNNLSEQLICFGTITPFFRLLEGISQQQYVCSFVPATVGIPDIKDNNPIKLYPNPTVGKIIIELGDAIEQNLSLELSNLVGQILWFKKDLKQKHELDLTFFPKGIYYLKVQSTLSQKVYKIIKE